MNKCLAMLVLLAATGAVSGSEFRAGFGRRQITPPVPIWMAGFDNRAMPAEGVAHDIWTKALAMEDGRGGRMVILTIEVAILPPEMAALARARVMERAGVDSEHLVLNFSHTHSGPAFAWRPGDDAATRRRMESYRNGVLEAMADAAGDAVADLKPARLGYGAGKVGFSHNRREPLPGGGWKFGMNPAGPVDQTVPVLRVADLRGRLRGVVFGLSCHPSALTYEFFVISGDFAGIAQLEFERTNPGTTAMFLQLCGGDQTTWPRRKMELAERYGRELAEEAGRVSTGRTRPVRGGIRVASRTIALPFAPFSEEGFRKLAKDGNGLLQRHAERMVKLYEGGRAPLGAVPYTIQAIQLGKEVTLVAMNGEVVVDYALRIKRELGAEGMIVAGYSNEIQSYIPSERVLKEGGYEAEEAIRMRSWPGPLAAGVEEKILGAVRAAVGEARGGR
jgi:hypothetical protein